MNHKKRNTLILAILAALGAIAILMTASTTDHSKDNKDDRPSGPVTSLAPSPGSLQAESANADRQAERACNAMLSKSVLEYNTQQGPLSLSRTGGNSTAVSHDDMLCVYSSSLRWAVGQASYQELTPKGMNRYNAARTGHDDQLIARPIPAREMPRGVTSAFYFTPATFPADMSSWYRNPGAQMLVGNKLVVISFVDFDVLPSGVRQAFMKNALKDVIK